MSCGSGSGDILLTSVKEILNAQVLRKNLSMVDTWNVLRMTHGYCRTKYFSSTSAVMELQLLAVTAILNRVDSKSYLVLEVYPMTKFNSNPPRGS